MWREPVLCWTASGWEVLYYFDYSEPWRGGRAPFGSACWCQTGWGPGTNARRGPSQRAGAALQPNSSSSPDKRGDQEGAPDAKEVEGCLLPACSRLAHLQPGDRASAATAPCRTQRAPESASLIPLLPSWSPGFLCTQRSWVLRGDWGTDLSKHLGLMPAAKALSKAQQSITLLPAQLGASGDPNWVLSLETARTGTQQRQVTACGGCTFPLVGA